MAGIFNFDLGTILSGVGQAAKDIRTAITGKEPISADKAAEIALKVQELEQKALEAENSLLLAQAKINEVEAASTDKFVSRWRPFIGWVCGVAFVMDFMLQPMAQWLVQLIGVKLDGMPLVLFRVDTTQMIPVLLGMLGLGGMRTFEKSKGVQGNH